jgi:hypothetical protein
VKHIAQPKTIEELDAALESTALKRVIVSKGGGDLWLCGQCCVAMLADTTLQEAIIACGQVGATATSDLMNGLWIFQIGSKWSAYNWRRVPELCMIRTVKGDKSHWTIRAADVVYDPLEQTPVSYDDKRHRGARTVIEILRKNAE